MVALKILERNSSSEDVLEMLELDGACIVANVLPSSLVETTVAEIMPFVERTHFGEDDFAGSKTRRTGALVARSPSCRDIVMNESVLDAARGFLLQFSDRIQLNLTQTVYIGPGEGAQELHRDRFGWGDFIPREIEPQFNAMWALTDFTAENGATRVVPGSHTWDYEREAKPSEICQAEMSRGSVLLHTGSVIHSGGKNRSDETRMGLNITYSLGWIRQEENQYLSCPPDVAKNLPIDLQELLGYTRGNYALGYYSDADGTSELGAGLLPPEAAIGASPRSRWIPTEDGYRSVQIHTDEDR
ncbi:MAG: phytanoyl-CoA dioxygenase family protein [Woeseiaceae bacterium]